MAEKITIILVDDHELVRQGIRAFLDIQPDLQVVGEADAGEEAVRLARELQPDVALMDLTMPGMDGVEATRRLKQVSPQTQVIVLTSYHDDAYIFPALKAGALSYVLKDIKAKALVEAIKKAVQGESVLNSQVASRVVKDLRRERLERPNLFSELSERELEVLRLIANGQSNMEIAQQLVLSEKTVKVHVSNILSKLNLTDRTQAAVFAWQEGLVRRSDT